MQLALARVAEEPSGPKRSKLEERFTHLLKGVAVVLVFVAAKLIMGPLFGLHVGSLASLLMVLGTLGASMLLPGKPAKHS